MKYFPFLLEIYFYFSSLFQSSRQYAGFVGLSSNLAGSEQHLDSSTQQLAALQSRVKTAHDAAAEEQRQIELVVREKSQVEHNTQALQLLMRIFGSIELVQRLKKVHMFFLISNLSLPSN